MNVERGKFESEETPEAVAAHRAQMDAIYDKMRDDPRYADVFEPFDEEASDARADADIAAGRIYPHSLVSEWLRTWGKPGRKPFHDWLNDRG